MRHRLQHSVCLSAIAITGAALSAPAMADDAAAAAGTAAAAPAYSAEIVVTAQKRTERLQDIPVAAAVLSADSVKQAHVSDLSDINRVVPSVQIKGTFNGRVPYGIRGISTNANEGAIGLTSGVSIQVDGIPVSADSFAANTITDVAQLEVLKGPQATLGGRTASAGVINFVTFGPTSEPKFAFDALATDDNEYRVDVRASGPISDTLSYSIAGYDSHTPYPIHNLQLDQQSIARSYGVRGKLKFAPTSDFDVTLMGHYALSKSKGENFAYQYITPGATLLGAPPLTQDLVLGGKYTVRRGNTSYDSPVNMTSRYEDKDAALVINYRAGGLTFGSTTSYFREKQFQSQDLFMTSIYFFDFLTGGHAPPFNDMQTNKGFVRQVTQEFKVASDASQPFSFLAGAFYSDTTVNGFGLREFVGFPAAQLNISKTRTYAVYGRVTEKFTDKIWLTGGLRYNRDKIAWDITQYFDPSKGYYGSGVFGAGGFQWKTSSSDGTLVGDAALQFHANRNFMGYASYTRGYKPAAYNTAHTFLSGPDAPSAADAPFLTPTKGETIDSFEVGVKTTALGGHLTFNADAFYTNYKNYQAQIFDNTKLIGILVLDNAGASTKGVEADVNYRTEYTSVALSAAYIDAKFKNFAGAQCYPTQTVAQGCVGGVQDLSGHTMPDAPKFKMNASVEQTIPLGDYNLLVGGNVSYRSSAVLQADGNPETRQSAFALLDASIGIETSDKKASLRLFVNNITNHFYLTNAEDFYSGPWGANAVLGQPARDSHRYFGGRVAFAF